MIKHVVIVSSSFIRFILRLSEKYKWKVINLELGTRLGIWSIGLFYSTLMCMCKEDCVLGIRTRAQTQSSDSFGSFQNLQYSSLGQTYLQTQID